MTFEKGTVDGKDTMRSDLDEFGWVRDYRLAKCPDSIRTETITIASKGGRWAIKAPEGIDTVALETVAKQVYVGAAADRSVAGGSGAYIMRHGQEMPVGGDIEDGEKMVFRNTFLDPARYLAEGGERILVTLYAEDMVHVDLCGIKAKRIGLTRSVYENSLDIVIGSRAGTCNYVLDCDGNDMLFLDPVLAAALRNQAILTKVENGYIGIIEYTREGSNRFVDINRYFAQGSAALNRSFASEEERGTQSEETEYDMLVKDETEVEIIGGAVEVAHVQDRRFTVTAMSNESGGSEEVAKLDVSLINFGKSETDPWPLIDGCGDPASELCELLYWQCKIGDDPEKINEPFLFIENANGEEAALSFLFSHLSPVAQKLYGVVAVAIGVKTGMIEISVPAIFEKEFEDLEQGFTLYRLN